MSRQKNVLEAFFCSRTFVNHLVIKAKGGEQLLQHAVIFTCGKIGEANEIYATAMGNQGHLHDAVNPFFFQLIAAGEGLHLAVETNAAALQVVGLDAGL